MKAAGTIAILLLVLAAGPVLWGLEEKPVVAVFDFDAAGVGEEDALLAVDVLGYNLMESGRALVIDRKARNNLLKGFEVSRPAGADDAFFCEAGELLHADYIILGSLRSGGGPVSLALRLLRTETRKEVMSFTRDYAAVADLPADGRAVIKNMAAGLPPASGGRQEASRLLTDLLPAQIKERILFIAPEKTDDERAALYLELVNELISRLMGRDQLSLYYAALDHPEAAPDLERMRLLSRTRDCHAFAFIRERDGKPELAVYTNELETQCTVPLAAGTSARETIAAAAGKVDAALALIPQAIVVEELRRALVIDRKIDPLVYSEKTLSRPFAATVMHKIIKSGFAGEYQPLLNMVDFEGEFVWYYGKIVGMGLGYGFAYSYAGMIDRKLSDYPLIQHHEIRLIPFCFRTGGVIGFSAAVHAALHLHDIYDITYLPDESHAYDNLQTIIYLRFGLNVGFDINFSETVALHIDAITLDYAVILANPPEHMLRLPFSGDLGGFGVTFRF
ncbi:MAG: hypothetical protein JXD23_12245 [Spirochaetales bacterium]|nr:hypothetical protein [Spirochaetales bacterium]